MKTQESRVKADYRKRVIPELLKKFGFSNVFEAPKIEKIVVNLLSGLL